MKLTLGAVMSGEDDAALHALDEVCGMLAEELGHPVELLLLPTPSELARAVGQGDAQLGWVSPTLLLMAPRLAKTTPLLSIVRSGRAYFHCVIFALRDTLDHVDSIVAARAAWVAPTSAAGYLVPSLMLTRRGIELSHAVAEERFYGTHRKVARAVANDRADFGATYAHYQDGDSRKPLMSSGYDGILQPEEVVVLAVTGPIPADMIVAHSSLSAERQTAIAEAMMRLSAKGGSAAAALERAANAEAFQRVGKKPLKELQKLVDAALELRLTTSAEINRLL